MPQTKLTHENTVINFIPINKIDMDGMRMNNAKSDVLTNPKTCLLELADQFNQIRSHNMPQHI